MEGFRSYADGMEVREKQNKEDVTQTRYDFSLMVFFCRHLKILLYHTRTATEDITSPVSPDRYMSLDICPCYMLVCRSFMHILKTSCSAVPFQQSVLFISTLFSIERSDK